MNTRILLPTLLLAVLVSACSTSGLLTIPEHQRVAASQHQQKLRSCRAPCAKKTNSCYRRLIPYHGPNKTLQNKYFQATFRCDAQKQQCVNACSARAREAMNRAVRSRAIGTKEMEERRYRAKLIARRKNLIANRKKNAGLARTKNNFGPSAVAVKRRDMFSGPATWLLVQSPLWPCLDRHKWRHTNRVSKCISSKNTRGKTIKVTSKLIPYIPPKKPKKSFGEKLTSVFHPKNLNPINYLKKMSGFCKPVKTGKGSVFFSPKSELRLLNVGLKSCGVMGKLFASNNSSSGSRFIGVVSILLDGKTARRCQAWQSTNKAHRRVGLKEHASRCLGGLVFTHDENRRQELFQITGISPDNKFGIATSVSILNSCASKKNWASYGRDATSEEVAFCKTRKTVQHSAAYEIEARQFRAGNGSQEIMMTIGWQRIARLDLNSNTRIKQVVMKYTCGNKSFARMRKNPRGTAVACIKDMLGLIAVPRVNLNAVLQNQADRMEKLGGYTGWGTNRAEEKAVINCMGNKKYLRPECRL